MSYSLIFIISCHCLVWISFVCSFFKNLVASLCHFCAFYEVWIQVLGNLNVFQRFHCALFSFSFSSVFFLFFPFFIDQVIFQYFAAQFPWVCAFSFVVCLFGFGLVWFCCQFNFLLCYAIGHLDTCSYF